jgi:putative hydrolase of the HAD superfamily
MAWLVCDYGDVISRTPTKSDVATLAALCRLEVDAFERAYWRTRISYDRGDIDAFGYWNGVVSGPLTPERLVALIEADVASWIRLNERATAAVEDAEARGRRLALLSNAPVEIARVIDAMPWFARFEHRMFSCDVRLTKPDPAIYRALLDHLDSEPSEVAFVDDRVENVVAAGALGIRAVHYLSPETFGEL